MQHTSAQIAEYALEAVKYKIRTKPLPLNNSIVQGYEVAKAELIKIIDDEIDFIRGIDNEE